MPILQQLGYQQHQIVRSKILQHPFLKIGSKKRPVNLIPDYLFKIEESYTWILDAKAPNENIIQGDNIEQVYSYAIHPEIRSKFFALCNGKEFVLFRQDKEKPLLYFTMQEIKYHWKELETYLSSHSFQSGKNFQYTSVKKASHSKGEFDYTNRPLLEELPA